MYVMISVSEQFMGTLSHYGLEGLYLVDTLKNLPNHLVEQHDLSVDLIHIYSRALVYEMEFKIDCAFSKHSMRRGFSILSAVVFDKDKEQISVHFDVASSVGLITNNSNVVNIKQMN